MHIAKPINGLKAQKVISIVSKLNPEDELVGLKETEKGIANAIKASPIKSHLIP